VKAFAFDKTGTLTEGRLELGDVLPLDGVPIEELLRAAAAAEQESEHPIARLILHEATQRQLVPGPVQDFLAHPGGGVTANSDGSTIVVGTRRLLEERGVSPSAGAVALLDRLDAAGQTPLLVARDGTVLGAIGARDRLRPEAADVIATLKLLGIERIALLTGDRTAVARAVAGELGIDEVHAELLPPAKAERIGGGEWAFVGDGINDAPALASARVGLAVGGGSDVAAEAGDIILMGDPLRPIPLVLRLSRETVRIIRQNIIVFAFAVNAVGIVLTGWLWPLFARSPEWFERAPLAGVIYHQIGSLAVLLNSMRLLAFDRAESGGVRRVRERLRALDDWLERWNLDHVLHELSHRWKTIAVTAALLGGVAFAAGGLTRVGPDEVAVVKRFGQLTPDDLTPGLHYRWPWPIESVVKIQPDRVRTVEVGFRTADADAGQRRTAGMTWASQHGEGLKRVAEEASMITGDGNLVEVLATVRYSVSDPRKFLFGARDPEAVLRSAAESALREVVAGETFLELLTVRRTEFQNDVQTRLARRLREADPEGLGIRLDGVSLHDLHPPAEVVPSYHEVARAMEARDRQVNDAEAQAIAKRRDAEVRAQRTVRLAEAAARDKVEQAEAARDGFLAWHRLRATLPPAEEGRLMLEAIVRVLAGRDVTSSTAEYHRVRADRLAARRFLVDFRLSWDAITSVLSRRDKIIIDSDKMPGRRHLLLFDPDQLRPPPTILTPDRGGRSRLGPESEP
jgi:Cu+-exporting ATPase